MKKAWIITTLATAFCASLGFGMDFLNVKAATSTLTTNTLSMEYGAAVRMAENGNGLRFSAEIGESEYTALTEEGAIFGALIIPNDAVGGSSTWVNKIQFDINDNNKASFTDTYSSASIMQVYNARCQNIDEDANVEICGAVVNFKDANLTRPYVGVIYVGIPTATQEVTDDATGETTTVATEYEYRFAPWYGSDMTNNTRCMYYVAQKAIEDKETAIAAATDETAKTELQADLDAMNTAYISACSRTGQNYGYYVTHHYVDGSGTERSFTELQYGLLNQTATASVSAADNPNIPSDFVDVDSYMYDATTTKHSGTPLDEGTVYAAGLQHLHIWYKPKDTAAILSDLFAEENASALYTGGTMQLNADGNLENTTDSSGGTDYGEVGGWFVGTGQQTVCLTAAFIYEMQRLGYTKISVTSISVEISLSLGSIFGGSKVTGVQLSGYLAKTATIEGVGDISVDESGNLRLTTDNKGYDADSKATPKITWDISEPITRIENEDGTYSYVYTNDPDTIAGDVILNAITDGQLKYTAEWTLNGLAVS